MQLTHAPSNGETIIFVPGFLLYITDTTMKSQGRFTFLLMVLFVFDTFLIDHVTASCQDHSRPYGVDWVNHWDTSADFDCGRGKTTLGPSDVTEIGIHT